MSKFIRWLAVLSLLIFLANCCGVPFAPRRKRTDSQCAASTKLEQCLECHNKPEKPISSITRHALDYEPCLRCHPVEPRR